MEQLLKEIKENQDKTLKELYYIKEELTGNEQFKRKGLIERVNEIEKYVYKEKKNKNIVFGFLLATSLFFKDIKDWVITLFNHA